MLDERSGVAVEPLEVAVVIIPPQGVHKGGAGREARCEDSPPLGRKAGKCSVAQWIAHGAGDGATDRALLVVLHPEAPDLIRTAGRTAPYG